MDRLLTEIQVLWANTMERLTINDLFDILIVTFMIYNLLLLTRETYDGTEGDPLRFLSIEVLRERLVGRGTDAPDVIESRLAKAEYELSFAGRFDVVIVNDRLEEAEAKALDVITQFLKRDE